MKIEYRKLNIEILNSVKLKDLRGQLTPEVLQFFCSI